MVSFIVRMRFRSEDREEIAGFLRDLTRLSREEAGCVNYVPHIVEGEPDAVLIYEQYCDQTAVDAHRHSEHFARYASGGLYQRMLDRSVEALMALA